MTMQVDNEALSEGSECLLWQGTKFSFTFGVTRGCATQLLAI